MVKYKIFSILLFILIGCKSNFNKSIQKESSNCKLFIKEFNIDENTFEFFKEEIISFINDEDNKYDILKIYYSGGGNRDHHLERWSINDKIKLRKIDLEAENKTHFTIDYSYNSFLNLFNKIENGSFMQICPYSSNNDTYTIIIKEEKKVKFKYISTSRNYNILNQNEINKISQTLNLISFLNAKSGSVVKKVMR